MINNSQVLKPCDNSAEETKFLIYHASDIGLGSLLGHETIDRIRPARFHSCKFNLAQLSYPTLQNEP